MDRDREKVVLQARLDLCRELVAEFPGGLTAQHIRVLEVALMDELRALEHSIIEDGARHRRPKGIAEKLRRKIN